MKTPDEIKKGLERCKDDRCICDECEFSDGNVKKWRSLMGDALSYIEQLEERASLNTLRDAIYEDAVAHGLWNEEYDIIGCTNVIEEEYLELEHAADDVQFSRLCFDDDNEAFQFYEEKLSDIIIASLSVAGKLGIDIDKAVRRKMEINRERPWKHGKEEKK